MAKKERKEDSVAIYQEVAKKVEELKREAKETNDWVNVIVAAVDDPATVALELVVSPPDENDNQRVFLRLRTARFNNTMRVTPAHIKALEALIDMIRRNDKIKALLEVLGNEIPMRRRRTQRTIF